MATPPINSLNGYPATLGGKVIRTCWVKGQKPYVNGVGQAIYDKALRSVDFVGGGFSVSGNYLVVAQPANVGPNVSPNAWHLRWFSTSLGEVTNGFDLSGEKVQILIVGG